MSRITRRLFPFIILAIFLLALEWAFSFGTLPEADFSFILSTEIESIDPAKITGQPEGQIVRALFEGLYRRLPTDEDPTVLRPQPAAAAGHILSEDRKTYLFQIRENARWSDGTPVTAHDFAWSWQRFLHPETASKYSYQLHYVSGARRYTASEVKIGDQVEIELDDRERPNQLFPKGTVLRGILRDLQKPEKPSNENISEEEKEKAEAQWKRRWIYVVEIKPATQNYIDWQAEGKIRRFCKEPASETKSKMPNKLGKVEKCLHVLPDFQSQVGIKAVDAQTLKVDLENPTPYFLDLVSFYPLYPVNRQCVETHGEPLWTKPENLVCNGAFQLEFRRIRDRIRMRKSPTYWNASNVSLETIDAMAVSSETTSLNMYINGQIQLTRYVPKTMIPELLKRNDFLTSSMLSVYYYRINVTRKPFDDVRVRRAMNMAVNKEQICQAVTRGGELPAGGFVPPGLFGYQGAIGDGYDVEQAKKLLAEAGYPGGRGFRKIEIVYNKLDMHEAIAEVIQRQWKKNLGINVSLRKLEWGNYLKTVSSLEYDVARHAWIADYPDPNTWLDMYVTGGMNNQTGWGNDQYDRLIQSAAAEPNPAERMKLFQQAETILLKEQPIIPIYYYVTLNLIRPYVKGFHSNTQDLHPLHILHIDQEEKRRLLLQEGLQ